MLFGLTAVFVIKMTCLVLGYFIVRTGAALLREGITGAFTFKADLQGAKADLASASPGLLFLLLGTILIGYALWVPKQQSFEIPTVVGQQAPPAVDIPGEETSR